MAVKFVKSGKPKAETAPPLPAATASDPAKPFKLKHAIDNPHQFTVKMVPEGKVVLKMLAAKLGVSNMTMFADALADLIAAPPATIEYVMPPRVGSVRFVFKVTQELAQGVHALANARDVSCQAVIVAALERLMAKHGVSL